ncbi:hypothetical protein SERLA73DRAFT_81316 [Serpula lacrymans var. lacrymans S7.3]|uniref:Uncharacterized protein n=1 Tax=Serpula lacrymans var. lacrymans (strain S7.3) TaxID=936435 RepID=F8QKW4_SERL3|nr:hypothetical protein SERLA73DRAFT_81316 [Serpula lacrymans var. lacrymans S7.3]
MHQSGQTFTPEAKSVCSLCHTILLRTIPGGMLSDNPMIICELLKFLGHVLSPFVIAQSLDFTLQLSLSISLESLESIKDI